jgi:hypothetical protein
MLLTEEGAEVIVDLCELGVEGDGQAVLRDRLAQLALGVQGVAEVGVGLRGLGVSGNGLAELQEPDVAAVESRGPPGMGPLDGGHVEHRGDGQ